jgi:hypothetical protein
VRRQAFDESATKLTLVAQGTNGASVPNIRMKELRVSLAMACSLALLACGGGERPSAASDDTADDAREMPGSGATSGEAVPPIVCSPGAVRACKLLYTQPSGTVLCPTSVQYCRTDGRGWQKCGEAPKDYGPPPITTQSGMPDGGLDGSR